MYKGSDKTFWLDVHNRLQGYIDRQKQDDHEGKNLFYIVIN